MAGRNSPPENLRRSHSLSLEASNGVRATNQSSTMSLDGMNPADIDAIVNKRWLLEEVIDLVQSKLAVLTGGRDKRGVPMVTITCNEHSNVGPTNIGKILSYLSKVVDESLQGKGFTVLLDMQKASWAVTKSVLNSLQLTFVEHIHHVFVIKPKGFWQKRKVGVSLSMQRAKYSFPVVLLDSASDLFQYISLSQVHKELGGSLVYHHGEWIEAQRCLEKHVVELKDRLSAIESLQEQLEQNEDPSNLNEARDAVRRHVEARPLLDRGSLDTACEAAIHAVSKLKGCNHPDITDSFNRIDELCGTLQSTRGRLQLMWDTKGGKLDQVLQLRVFENDSRQLLDWIDHETSSLAREHTDIGDSQSAAIRSQRAFHEFTSRFRLKGSEFKRVLVLSEKLVGAQHYAANQIQEKISEITANWDRLTVIIDERESLLVLAISFYDRQQKYFDDVEQWSDTCTTKDTPDSITTTEQALTSHKQLQEVFQTCYSISREEGHKIIEKLRKPVGDSALPHAFVARTRNVKEILESLFDEHNWLVEQWKRRNIILEQSLCLKKYQNEAKEVYDWLDNIGAPFLLTSNSIGRTVADTAKLMENHTKFEKGTVTIYAKSSQLLTKATELANSGECNPDLIDKERLNLKHSSQTFTDRLERRKEILTQAQELFKNVHNTLDQFRALTQPIPRESFINQPTLSLEKALSKYTSQHSQASSSAADTHTMADTLLQLLRIEVGSAESSVDYSAAIDSVKARVERVTVEVESAAGLCGRRERLWDLSIQFNQLQPDVDKHVLSLESWTQEQDDTGDPATNLIDAQLQLDAFQRQYNLYLSSHTDLVSRGRLIAKELTELDKSMFGVMGSSAHSSVEVMVVRLQGAVNKMKSVGEAKLKQLKCCLQFFLLQQKATELTSTLTTLSSSLSFSTGIADTLDKARHLHQKAIEHKQKCHSVSGDIDKYCLDVGECVNGGYSQSSSLNLLAKRLKEKRQSIEESTEDKVQLTSATVDLHEKINELFSAMEDYDRDQNYDDLTENKQAVEELLKSSEEQRSILKEAVEKVQSQGKQLNSLVCEFSSKNASSKTFSFGDYSPQLPRRLSGSSKEAPSSPKPSRNRPPSEDIDGPKGNLTKSLDALDSKEDLIIQDKSLEVVPKVLVAPRKARTSGLKLAKSMPSLGPAAKEQEIIDSLLDSVSVRMVEFEEEFTSRMKWVYWLRDVAHYREEVKVVLAWVQSTGEMFLQRQDNLGKSIEEVQTLKSECNKFKESEVSIYSEQVSSLNTLYQTITDGQKPQIKENRSYSVDVTSSPNPILGIKRAYTVNTMEHVEDNLNDDLVLLVQSLNSTLDKVWGDFNRDFTRYATNLDLSLKFNRVIFEATNWCQTSTTFLDKMEDKVAECESAPQAKDLLEELTMYLSVTKDQQTARVEQLKNITEYIQSSAFMEMTNKIARSTSRTQVEIEKCERNLRKLLARFTQIENDRDREKRLTKQREHVLEELLQTELSYVKDLKLILKCRPRFIRADMLPNTLRGKESIIFGNINDIESFHRENLLPRMQGALGDAEATANLFVEFAEDMKRIYVPFCRDKSASEELLASHRSYLNRMQSLFVTDTPLSSLLIKPVQRITKYPLLLKDLLKFTTELEQPTLILEKAVKAVEKIPVVANNALHLSYLENSTEVAKNLGELVCQGTLLVSDSKFGIKAEKERQVFGFEKAFLFARKVDIDRQKATFKYELKSKLPISVSIQIIEFIEGEPCKFALLTADNRLYLKANSVDSKQDWVKVLRSNILSNSGMEVGSGLLAIQKDLMNPSPFQSPVTVRKSNENNSQSKPSRQESMGFETYVVKEDFHPKPISPSEVTLSLNKGDIVEVLDNSIEGKWYVRVKSNSLSPKTGHGWIPSSFLEKYETESTDGRKGWVQITAGPLSGGSDDDKWKALKPNSTGFGSHDIQSQQVISALKKVTFGEDVRSSDDSISLDRVPRPGQRPRSQTMPEVPREDQASVAPAVSHRSASNSPSQPTTRRSVDSHPPVFEGDSPEWTKSQWRKKVIKRRRSDVPEESVSEPVDNDKLHTSSSEEGMDKVTDSKPEEADPERVEKAQQKLQFIMAELLETEREYVERLEKLITGYLPEMQSPNLPDSLKGKDKLIFGNIQDVYKFHNKTFLQLLENASDSVERTAACFLDQTHQFEVYVTYCENKPISESFIWTYQHNGGTFFKELQDQLGHKQGIDSYLIKPVQRITKYKLLLADLLKTAKKTQLTTPNLEKAVAFMEEIPKRANDAMTLSMICGYDGNISSYGQLIANDEFNVYERSKRTSAKRHVFLLDQRLIFTKQKESDGLYTYKDSLKIHSLSVAEREGDDPCRFAVGTGSVESWDQFYILEASSPEKKKQWVQSIKDILKGQFELLQALQGPRPRSATFDPSGLPPPIQQPKYNDVSMINFSDDSEQEDEEYQPPLTPKLHSTTIPRFRPTHTVAEPTPSVSIAQTRPFNLYIVAEDCAPPKDNEGIMYVRRGQVFDVLDSTSDWWLARLIRDVVSESEVIAEQGWVPGSFLDKYEGSLSAEEERVVLTVLQQKRLKKMNVAKKEPIVNSVPFGRSQSYNPSSKASKSNGSTKQKLSPKRKKSNNKHTKITITSSLSFQESSEKDRGLERSGSLGKGNDPKGPEILTPLVDETVLAGRSVQFKCTIKSQVSPAPNVTWSRDGVPLSIDRAFTSFGEKMCVLKINEVQRNDSGVYVCTISNKMGVVSSKATLTVLSPPSPPGLPSVRALSPSSVQLSWVSPPHDGNSSINLYLVECRDSQSDRWSTIMKRISGLSTVVDELTPGAHYDFRVLATNQIGSSEPSAVSAKIQLPLASKTNEFSLESFDDQYQQLDEIAQGQFGTVYEYLHMPAQHFFAAKLLPLSVGQEHAENELSMLSRLAHPNLTQMVSAYLTPTHYVIVFQIIHGSNVCQYVASQDDPTEATVASLTSQLTAGLQYLHQSNIAHLNLRPRNILVTDDVGNVKLVHFERSKVIDTPSSQVISRREEAIEFEAPEVLVGDVVSTLTDMWSLGVLLYILLVGFSPFSVDSLDLTKDNITNVRVPTKPLKALSNNAKDLLSKLLIFDKSQRLTSVECGTHPWLTTPTSSPLNSEKLKELVTKKWGNSVKTTTYSML